MKKSTTAIFMIIYLFAVTLVFSVISILCGTDTTDVYPSENGVVDLTDIDFDWETITIKWNAIYIYDLAFYTSEDFASGNVTQEPIRLFDTSPNLEDYGTIRILLKLPPGVYAISAKNTSYAQRLFINGEEYPSVGVTGDSVDAVTPKTARYTAAFAPEDDTTEIVLHYSNFVHSDTGGFYTITLGSVQNITRGEQLKTLRVAAVTFAIVTAMLFFFGMFMFFGKSRYFLWFSLACGCIALRGLLIDDKAIMLLLPNLDWYLAIRLEYLATCGVALFSILYLNTLFPGAANKWALRGFTVFSALNAAFICLTQPLLFTRFATATVCIYALFGVYLLSAILVSVLYKKRTAVLLASEQVLLLAGFLIYLLMSAFGIHSHMFNTRLLWGLDYPETGMMIFLFINLLTLALGFSRTERKLDAALQNERELEESNRMLERLDKLKNDFLQNISHEMKTPLAVMSNSAGVTLKQICRNAVDTETEENLNAIQNEAVRLGELVEQLTKVSLEKQRQLTLTDTDAMTLLKKAAAFCEPICRGNENRITVDAKPGRIPLRVDADGIFQVFINLITNANKYTRRGVITLNAEFSEDNVLLTVSDNGLGLAPALKGTVFQRGASGDGGTGLGLAICKEIVEEHGGQIGIQSDVGEGTAVCFTLPCTGRGESV